MARFTLVETVWHRWLKRPYHLRQTLDRGDRLAPSVVLLHGIAGSTAVWHHLLDYLMEPNGSVGGIPNHRLIAFDLLGHGQSPKPQWPRYSVDDHARSIINSLQRCRLRQPVVLVGHSMGCLVAVRVARLRPDLVRHLVLYEMPLYAGLPDKRSYRIRLAIYYKLYQRVIAYQPIFVGPGKGKAQRIAERFFGLVFNDQTWLPFVRSLEHTILGQATVDDIRQLRQPMDVIYGTRDRVVIRGKTRAIFGQDATNINAYSVRASHTVSKRAARFLMQRIVVALEAGRRLAEP